MPGDVLIVEDDPIIALDFEDTILGFGVKAVRTAANVARALEMIADRAPDFALLDVGLVREKSFAIAERLEALKIPFVFVTGYGADVRLPAGIRGQAAAGQTLFERRAAGVAEKRRLEALAVDAVAALTTPASDRASSTTAPHRRGRARSPSSGRSRRRS